MRKCAFLVGVSLLMAFFFRHKEILYNQTDMTLLGLGILFQSYGCSVRPRLKWRQVNLPVGENA